MSPSSCRIENRRPVPEVFRWLDDDQLALRWIGGLTAVVPLTDDGNRVGARARHVYVENGRRIEMVEETLVHEPDRRVTIRGESDGFTMTAEYTVTPRGDGTLLELTTQTQFEGRSMRLLAPLLAGFSRRRVTEDLERLKALVEST